MNARRLGVVLGFLFWLPALRAEENRAAHVLIVADTVDRNVGRITEQDALTMGYLMKNSIPRDRLSLHVLYGEQATPADVGRYYEGLRVDPRDAVLLFYSGHGAWDPERGHLLTLNAGTVARSDLLRVMQAKGARLTVLVTNCCSNWVRTRAFGRDDEDAGTFSKEGFSPVLRCLLFQHQGVVDFTAAKQGTYAWGDLEGGWFTIALARVLQASPHQLDLNGDGFVSWDEVFRLVRSQTQTVFNERASPRDRQLQDGQEPVCFRLGSRLDNSSDRIPAAGPRPRGRHQVAVTISNPISAIIVYQFRWGEQEALRSFVLPPGFRTRHWCAATAEDEVPVPQIVYQRGFLGDLFAPCDAFNLQARRIDPRNRQDPGKCYEFAVVQEGFRQVVKLKDPEASRDDSDE